MISNDGNAMFVPKLIFTISPQNYLVLVGKNKQAL